MAKRNLLRRYLISSLLAGLGFLAILFLSPELKVSSADNFSEIKIPSSFVNIQNTSQIDTISLYDFEPIFLPTKFNKTAQAPSDININSFENINDFLDFSSDSYTAYVLNKKESRLNRINNIFHTSIVEIMPYYNIKEEKDSIAQKDFVNISVLNVQDGKEVICENFKIEEFKEFSNFLVPVEVFMNIRNDLSINIADNTSSSTLEASTTKLIRDAIADTKIFHKLNSGYYKIIISP